MIVPRLAAADFKTYEILAPMPTHFRPATCREIECRGYIGGWSTSLTADDPRCDYIRRSSGRRFREERNPDGTVTFLFEPGQMCFRASEHRVSLEREPIYVVRGGDFRGNPLGTPARRHRAADWVNDFAEHQDGIASAIERG